MEWCHTAEYEQSLSMGMPNKSFQTKGGILLTLIAELKVFRLNGGILNACSFLVARMLFRVC